MTQYKPYLDQAEQEYPQMVVLLKKWSDINSGTRNLEELVKIIGALQESFNVLGGKMETIALSPLPIIALDGSIQESPLGKALRITKRPNAPKQVFLGGHMDIAYPPGHPFEKCRFTDSNTLVGRGTADMKGGLIIMLTALKILESSPYAKDLGWEVLINPDEEIGSPGSASLFKEAAKRHQIGLIFEPSFPDGSIVNKRKGSSNFTLAVKGKAAHAGRDYFNGRNALTAASRFALAAEALTDREKETTVNIGYFESAEAVNIVPDHALCRFNIRAKTSHDMENLIAELQNLALVGNTKDGIGMTLVQETVNYPKIFDSKTEHLFNAVKLAGQSLGMELKWTTSGGVCDGNVLANAGLPTIDTLGVIGGNLHTTEEYMKLDSLIERTKLTTLILMQFATEEFKI